MTLKRAHQPTVFIPLADLHARYFALALRSRGHAGDLSAMGTALLDARVDLNPHQIEAALFAIQASPGVGRILADEVGLGKTIEAALVLTQRWAERRRRLLVIVPAALRRQWATELEEKFGLPCRILDGPRTLPSDFDDQVVLICSYHFAARHEDRLVELSWDLVVFDEAHRLRTIRRSARSIAGRLVRALNHAPLLLLTATPLQNSLLELHALVSIVSEDLLGDESTFRALFLRGQTDYDGLRERLREVCQRTLRRDVLPYVQYTSRHAMTWSYESTGDERALYDAVTHFIAREELVSVPVRVRALMRMLLRKLLASSPAAIAGALAKLRARLDRSIDRERAAMIAGDLEPAVEFADEGFASDWADREEDDPEQAEADEAALTREDLIEEEARVLDGLLAMAGGIQRDSRAMALAEALSAAFTRLKAAGAAEKAVIFTESLRTQQRLRDFFEQEGYRGRVVCFSGGGGGPAESAVLSEWTARHPELAARGRRSVNMRAAIVERFREHASILIATEAGSEGLNLQFCSLVVNYDLPWNPQRVEQRIGRCHRYGQRHDVIVLNFVDRSNHAELRVLELLGEKIGIFEGALGASDAILGAIEGGIDLERQLHRIITECRTPDAIDAAFAALRVEMDDIITRREVKAHQALFEHFDDAVHDRLRLRLESARVRLDRMGRQFWSLVRWALADRGDFDAAFPSFYLREDISKHAPSGTYALVGYEDSCARDAQPLRASHPLGELVIDRALAVCAEGVRLVFDISGHPLRVSAVEALKGKTGWIACERLSLKGLGTEEHLVLSGHVVGGPDLTQEDLEELLAVGSSDEPTPESSPPARAIEGMTFARELRIREAASRNQAELQAAQERLERWASDQIRGVEAELDAIRREHEALSRRARLAPTADEARDLQHRLRELDTAKRRARVRVFEVEDEVAIRRDTLIAELEQRAAQTSAVERVFLVPWRVV